MRRGLLLLWVVVMLGGLAACDDSGKQAAKKPATPPLVGLDLERLDGTPDALENYRGKVVVLNIWATWCPPCRREMPSLQRLSDRLDPNSFAVLGVALKDHPGLVREFLRSKGVRFAAHIDYDGNMLAKYFDISAIPVTYVIDRSGRIVWSKTGELAWDEDGVERWLKELL